MAEQDLLERIKAAEPQQKPKLQRPPMYKVILHNDDYTPFELVIKVLVDVFKMNQSTAVKTMLHAHQNGLVVCGVYPKDVAETKTEEAKSLAKSYDYALHFSFEPEE